MTSNEALSATMSVLALLSSFWIWLLQRRRERPRLETWWGAEKPFWTGRCFATENENMTFVYFEVTLLFANLSTLADALLDIRCRVRAKEGGWLPVTVLRKPDPHQDTEYPGLPLELPPRQVVDRYIGFGIEMPDGVASNPSSYLAEPMQLDVELIGLGARSHRAVIVANAVEQGE